MVYYFIHIVRQREAQVSCWRWVHVQYLDVDEVLCLGDHLPVSVLDRRLRVANARRPMTRAAQNLTTQSRDVHVLSCLLACAVQVHAFSSLIPPSYRRTCSESLQFLADSQQQEDFNEISI